MILQSLEKYYKRISGVGQEGFQQQGISFIIVLNKEGDFAGLLDTREGEGKKKMARSFLVPKVVKKSVNIAANLLWGTPAYVLGRPKPDKKKDAEKLLERAKEQQANFLDKITMTKPSELGYDDKGYILPKLNIVPIYSLNLRRIIFCFFPTKKPSNDKSNDLIPFLDIS
ncbi:type I-C CRISPR-associated protein Cas8c/Csd1 [bacterium]|nr:type I-C CRISPR-associated protein Cas8c/Csd1 [bacterium]